MNIVCYESYKRERSDSARRGKSSNCRGVDVPLRSIAVAMYRDVPTVTSRDAFSHAVMTAHLIGMSLQGEQDIDDGSIGARRVIVLC